MDSPRRLALLINQKGMVFVYIALFMVALCAFLGLAVDVGYLYVAKGQLQNAADSAALAGASGLPDQTDARDKAKTFAEINTVVPGTETNVAVSPGDIILGNWNSSRSETLRFQPYTPPINAVKVQARRTEGSIGGPVDLFFSKIIDTRWSQMGVSAAAVAARTPRAGFYFMIGNNVCNSASFPVVLSPGANNMAWTSLLQISTNADDVKDDYICPADRLPDEDVCGYNVYTTNGTASTVFQGVETDFYDPNYDAINKTFALDETGNQVVSTWTVIVPVSSVNDPSAQPAPQPVWGYAQIRMIRACGNGVGNACNAEGRLFTAPGSICSGGEDDIVIDQATCVSCENSSELLGVRPNLVQ